MPWFSFWILLILAFSRGLPFWQSFGRSLCVVMWALLSSSLRSLTYSTITTIYICHSYLTNSKSTNILTSQVCSSSITVPVTLSDTWLHSGSEGTHCKAFWLFSHTLWCSINCLSHLQERSDLLWTFFQCPRIKLSYSNCFLRYCY